MYFPLFMELNDPTDKGKENKEKCKKLLDLKDKDIEKLLEKRLSFTGKCIDIYSRYSAYDYCYNYFRDIHEDFLKRGKRELEPYEMEKLCLQLGLFLATWGMFRNIDLQTNNFRIYEPLIKKIFEEEELWNIDVDKYCEKGTLESIEDFSKKIKASLPFNVSDTLATKIMMVVFGCVPAYDSYFSSTLEPMSFSKKSLEYIYKFYQENKGLLDQKQRELKTVSVKGGLTDYTYTIAKIIDIIGFHEKEKTDIKNMEKEDREKRENLKKEKEENLEKWLFKLEPELEKDCKKGKSLSN